MSRRPLIIAAWLAVAAAGLMVASPLSAQRSPDERRGRFQNREQLEQRIRAQMGRLIRERLGLSEEEATELGEVVEGFEEQRREIFRLEVETRQEVRAILDDPTPDQAEAEALLERMAELRAREARLFAEEQEALLTVLTPTQILELHDLRAEIGRRIRELRRRDGGSRRGGRGEDGAWPRWPGDGAGHPTPGSIG